MQVKVKLFATLRQGREKEYIFEIKEGMAVSEIISSLKIAKEEIAILLVNGINSSTDRLLSENDVISIFPPMGGG